MKIFSLSRIQTDWTLTHGSRSGRIQLNLVGSAFRRHRHRGGEVWQEVHAAYD
jgi:hypothetical protein